MKWPRVLLYIGLFIAAVFIAVFLSFYQYLHHELRLGGDSQVLIEIPKGSSLDQFVAQLQQKKLVHHPMLLRKWLLWRDQQGSIRAGSYIVRPGMKLSDLIDQVVFGKIKYYRVTFVPGQTYQNIDSALKKANVDYVALSQSALAHQLNTTHTCVEGLFFPDTYYITSGETSIDVLTRAHQQLVAILQQEWQQRAKDLPYKIPYQALIVASLIEKETAYEQEKPLVASVILNRLKKNMRLQVDASSIYGLDGRYGRVPTPADLKQDSKYNTYLHYGLPPTPIALVSRSSLHAALHPAQSDYLFYFANFSGSHVFSKTFISHKDAIQGKKLAYQITQDIVHKTLYDNHELTALFGVMGPYF